MAKCIVTTYIEHDFLERLDAEAERRGVKRAALAREVLEAAFPRQVPHPLPPTEDNHPDLLDEED